MPRQRVEWFTLIGIVVFIATSFAYSHTAEVQRAFNAEQTRLNSLGNVLSGEIATNLTAVSHALAGVLRDHMSIPRKADPALINRRLNALREAMPQLRGFTVLDPRGIVIAASPLDVIGLDLSTRSYFITARMHPSREMVYISAPFKSVRGDQVISVTRMVTDANGQFSGIITAILDPKYFSVLLNTALYAPDVKTFIAHSDGQSLVEVSAPFTAGSSVGPATAVKDSALQRIVAIAPHGVKVDKTLLIGVTRERAAILAPLERQARIVGIILASLALAAAAALQWSQRRRQRAWMIEQEQRNEQVNSAAVRQSEARFRILIEEAPVAVAIVRRGHFIYTNRRYNLLHGYRVDEDLTGIPWRAMIAPDSLAKLGEQEARINADTPVVEQFEAFGLGKDDVLVPVLKATASVELMDGPATLIFTQDISPQKRAEALVLEARDAAQDANNSKAQFLANMSHEIRTPLNAILGMAYLLEQSSIDQDAHAMLIKIRAAGKSLLGIINDILDVSKIDAGQMNVEKEWFTLEHVVDRVAAMMGVAVANRKINLLVHPLPPDLGSLQGDPLRLEQVLSNLTSNAIKFTYSGSVELFVSIAARGTDQVTLRFSIKDSGIGIAPDAQESIFKPFTQADGSTTRRFGGSGLGLTICKQLVQLMGGDIGLDSSLGQGSEFWFTLPFAYAAAAEFSAPEMIAIDVLIMHEDALALTSLAATARGLGWQVATAASARQAMARIVDPGARLPSVVLLNRPNGDTMIDSMAREIRAALPENECPIVIMTTTYELAALANSAEAAAIDAFLTKPVTASTLYNAVIAARRKRGNLSHEPSLRREHNSDALAGIRLLVVDDSEINRDVAKRILCGAGAQVALAEDGRQAVDWLQAHPDDIDLVLMDVQMPVLDGIEACKLLRAMPCFDDLPIVALTAGAFQSQQDAARAAGMTEFITKPFDIPRTIALVKRLRRTSSTAQAQVLDLQQGLQLWGSVDEFTNYLRRFTDTFAGSMTGLRAALAASDDKAARSLVHKLAGAAANVALPELAGTAMALEVQLAGGARSDDMTDRLEQAYHRAAEQIARLLDKQHENAVPDDGGAVALAPGEQAHLFSRLLDALDGDRITVAHDQLKQLARGISDDRLAPIQHALVEFDVRRAERAAIGLAGELGINVKAAR